MKKGIEHISVNTVRAIFLLHGAVQNIFENTGGRVLMLVMTACGNFAFTWIFWPIFGRYLRNIQHK